jgi:hypothetical protein
MAEMELMERSHTCTFHIFNVFDTVDQPVSTGPGSEGAPVPDPSWGPLEEPSLPLLDFEGPVETPLGANLGDNLRWPSGRIRT